MKKNLAALLSLMFLSVLFGCSASRPHLSESGSLQKSRKGGFLFTANFDAGSVAKISARTGERLAELNLGVDMRRLALSSDDALLLASDFTGGTLFLVSVRPFRLKRRIPVSGRPFGIVFDNRNQLFWVALFEDSQLLGVNRKGRITVRIPTAETPRGLALLRDGRLLVSHSMIGKVSLYNTLKDPPNLLKTITLHESQNPDELVSQGKPRLLDDIAVSPDERVAWLPHLLWNFDHPFQFQSTVFPSVSVIQLDAGKEREIPEYRKHLFKQINLLAPGGKSQIISNPHDMAFSADGKKAFVTLAGSEDLLVFDLSRQARLGKKRAKRRRGKLSQGGAKAIQLLRHLPGDNPRGILTQGDTIFVQNAMSQDLTKLQTGGGGPFARVRVSKPSFAKTVGKDPLSRQERRGATLFYNGNTSKFFKTPMAGDFWMSCSSCHVDGFNFTNRYLFKDTQRDVGKDAVTGHKDLAAMIGGDFIGDYIRIIQDTQGGMGADPAAKLRLVHPDKPGPEVKSMMNDLHVFVIRKENLPYLSTWLRLDDKKPFLNEKEWSNPAACRACHQEVFDQWADSTHRLMGSSQPYYQVMEDFAAQTEGEDFRKWCMGCHNPKHLLAGKPKSESHRRPFEKGGHSLLAALNKNKPILDEGTDCLFCHRITHLEDAGGNAGFTVNLKNRERYLFEEEKTSFFSYLGQRLVNAKPEVHAKSYSQPFYKDPKLCKSCHNEFSPGPGAVIVDTYGEWEQSPYNDPSTPKNHRTCIDCHMHADVKKIGENIPGQSTTNGRIKENIATHQFTGANHFLAGLRSEELEEQSIALLRRSAKLEILPVSGGVRVRTHNIGAGHGLPTGVSDLREFWLRVTVRDGNGKTVLESGKPKADGALPEDTRKFEKILGDAKGNPAGLRFWRVEKLLKNTVIPAKKFRDEDFLLPQGVIYPISVDVRLHFRIIPPKITKIVQWQYPDFPSPPIIELNYVNKKFAAAQP